MTQKKTIIALHMPSTFLLLFGILLDFLSFDVLLRNDGRLLQNGCKNVTTQRRRRIKKKSANYFEKTMCHSAHPKLQNFLKNKISLSILESMQAKFKSNRIVQ